MANMYDMLIQLPTELREKIMKDCGITQADIDNYLKYTNNER